MHEAAQVAAKQRVLEDCFDHIAKLKPEAMLAPIHGPTWGYRRKARLSVRYVLKKGGMLVGFHERKSSFVADMRGCEVLPPKISALLPELRTLIEGLSIRDRLPQIEFAMGDSVAVLVLRILDALSPPRMKSASKPSPTPTRCRSGCRPRDRTPPSRSIPWTARRWLTRCPSSA